MINCKEALPLDLKGDIAVNDRLEFPGHQAIHIYMGESLMCSVLTELSNMV